MVRKGYIQQLRALIGSRKLIHPAGRIIIENSRNEVLVIERADNGKIGIPAGALEEGETIEECMIREVAEETGIRLVSLEVIGISTEPNREWVQYPNGDQIQYFTVEFYSDQWDGTLWDGTLVPQDLNEVRRAFFMDRSQVLERIPENEQSAFQSLEYYRKFQRPMLK